MPGSISCFFVYWNVDLIASRMPISSVADLTDTNKYTAEILYL